MNAALGHILREAEKPIANAAARTRHGIDPRRRLLLAARDDAARRLVPAIPRASRRNVARQSGAEARAAELEEARASLAGMELAHRALLEMLGERQEEAEALRAEADELRETYRIQVDALLSERLQREAAAEGGRPQAALLPGRP